MLADFPRGVILYSREKSPEEHIYRLLRIHLTPEALENMVKQFAESEEPVLTFTNALTSFERFCVHTLAPKYQLKHQTLRDPDTSKSHAVVIWKPNVAVNQLQTQTASTCVFYKL